MKKLFLTGGVILSILPLTAKAETPTPNLDTGILGSSANCSGDDIGGATSGEASMLANFIPNSWLGKDSSGNTLAAAQRKGKYFKMNANPEMVEYTANEGTEDAYTVLVPSDSSAEIANCEAGYFCAGDYGDEVNNMIADGVFYSAGEVSCSDKTSGKYPNSDAGSDDVSDCYYACNADNVAFISNAHVSSANNAWGWIDNREKIYESDKDLVCEKNIVACEDGYEPKSIASLLPNTIDYTSHITDIMGNCIVGTSPDVNCADNLEKGEWFITINNDEAGPITKVAGNVKCVASLSDLDTAGSVCVTKVTAINNVPVNGSVQQVHVYSDTNDCQTHCGVDQDHGIFDYNVASIGNSRNVCMAKTITLKWSGVTPTNAAANSCVYDGGLTLPENSPVLGGYEFVGWTPAIIGSGSDD